MMLSPVLAQQIAGETTEAIGHNVIITDGDGIVTGSGDVRRVGSLHEASLQVMETQESAWHSPEQARALTGVRPGITLPLVIGGEAVGTVGITGSPRQVRRFGLLVRRQTEILLEQAALLRSRMLRERALEDLVGEIVAFHPDTSDLDQLTTAARDLGFTLVHPRVPVLLEVQGATIGPELLRTVRAVFHHSEDIVAVRSAGQCLVLAHVPGSGSRDDDAARMLAAVEDRFGATVRIGLGEPARSVPDLRHACQDAADALSLGSRVGPVKNVVTIRELRVHQALASIPHSQRERFRTAVLGRASTARDWAELRPTVIAWCESGFNLVAAAAALHLHRNTMLYRLSKLEHLVGHPWRDHRAMLSLYLACLTDQLGQIGRASCRERV
jgi:carbohydrate diacid regulator